MSAPLTIEDALLKIAADNDLTTVTICVTPQFTPGPHAFHARGHYDGPAKSGIGCSGGYGATVADALQAMLIEARANRVPDVACLPTLELQVPA